ESARHADAPRAEWIVPSLAPAGAKAAPESLQIRRGSWEGGPAVLVTGGDATGLMYGLLDIADRIGWAAGTAPPFSHVVDAAETPAVGERGVTLFTMQRRWFEDRLHDERYWTRYLDMLARDRFNVVQILFAY